MSTLATLVVKLVGDIGGFTQSMEASVSVAEKTVRGIGGKLSGLGDMAKNALSFAAGGLITKGLDLVGQGIGGVKAAMIDGNAEFERYETQFGVLLGSTDAARKRLEDLAEFGAKTPFELPEVVRADKILQAFGLHAEDTAKKFGMSGTDIRTVAGDVAAGTGASFEEISSYLGKFSAGATGEAISRMQELGITTRAELTKMGLEFDKSGALVSPLDKSMGVLLTAMKGKFGGMMDAQSSTFEGMISNLQDWLGQTGRIIGKPIFDVLKTNLGNLLTFLNSDAIKNGLTGFANAMATGIQTTIDTVSKGVAIIQDVWGDFQDGFNEGGFADGLANGAARLAEIFGVSTDGATRLGDMVYQAGRAVETFISGLQGGKSIFDAFASALFSIGGDDTPAVLVSIGQAVQQLGTVFEGVVSWVTTNWPLIQSTVVTAFTTINGAISTVRTALLDGVIGVFSSILGVFLENGPLLQETFQNTWNTLVAVISGVLGQVQPILNGLLSVIRTVFGFITGAIQEHGTAILTNLTTAWNTILATVQPIVGAILTVVQTVLGAVRDFLATHGAEIQAFLGGAWEKVSSIVLGVVQILQATIVPILTAIAQFVSDNQEGIKAAFSLVWGTLKFIVEGALTIIDGLIKTIMAVIKGDWQGAWEAVKGIFVGIWEGIKKWFEGVPAMMVQAGKDAIAGLVKGLIDAKDSVGQALIKILKDAIGGAINFVTNAQQGLNNIGTDIGNGIKTTVDNIFGGGNAVRGGNFSLAGGNSAVLSASNAMRPAFAGVGVGSNGETPTIRLRGPIVLQLPDGRVLAEATYDAIADLFYQEHAGNYGGGR